MECYQQSTAIDVHAHYSQLGWSMIFAHASIMLTVIEVLYVTSHHRSTWLQVHFFLDFVQLYLNTSKDLLDGYGRALIYVTG